MLPSNGDLLHMPDQAAVVDTVGPPPTPIISLELRPHTQRTHKQTYNLRSTIKLPVPTMAPAYSVTSR